MLPTRILFLMNSKLSTYATGIQHSTAQETWSEGNQKPESRPGCHLCSLSTPLHLCLTNPSFIHTHSSSSILLFTFPHHSLGWILSILITKTPAPCSSQRSSGQSLYVGLNPPTLLARSAAASYPPPQVSSDHSFSR